MGLANLEVRSRKHWQFLVLSSNYSKTQIWLLYIYIELKFCFYSVLNYLLWFDYLSFTINNIVYNFYITLPHDNQLYFNMYRNITDIYGHHGVTYCLFIILYLSFSERLLANINWCLFLRFSLLYYNHKILQICSLGLCGQIIRSRYDFIDYLKSKRGNFIASKTCQKSKSVDMKKKVI